MTNSRSDISYRWYVVASKLFRRYLASPSNPRLACAFSLAGCVWLTGCCGIQYGQGCGGGCGSIFQGEIASRITHGIAGGCASGCGEIYCDEHISEPPTCDPCGMNGDYMDGTYGTCRPLFHRLHDMLGNRYAGDCNDCGSCSTCNSCSTCDHDGGYAVQAGGHSGGYCPSCHDGSAGVPLNYSHSSGQTRSQNPNHSTKSQPTPANRPANNPPSTDSLRMNDPAPRNLQPIPDAAADAIPGEPPAIPSARRPNRSHEKISSNQGQFRGNAASNRRPQPRLVAR